MKIKNIKKMSIEFVKRFVPDLSLEAEDRIFKTSPEYVQHYAWVTNNPDHIDKLLNHPDYMVRSNAASNPNANDQNIYKGLNDSFYRVRVAAASNPNVKEHHLDLAISDVDDNVKDIAARHVNLTDEQIGRILNNADEESWFKSLAANNSNIKKKNLELALNDRDGLVRSGAKQNKRYKEYFPNGH